MQNVKSDVKFGLDFEAAPPRFVRPCGFMF